MTKHERAEVETAIRELMGDECLFDSALVRLCKLVGWRYPAGEIPLTAITVEEVARGPQRAFGQP